MANTTVVASLNSAAAASVSLTPRWSYLLVENGTGVIADNSLYGAGLYGAGDYGGDPTVGVWVRTDGTAATVGGDFCEYVPPNGSQLVANSTPLWTQAASLIGNGINDSQGTSIYGGTANPGTTVSIILTSGSGPQSVIVSAAG